MAPIKCKLKKKKCNLHKVFSYINSNDYLLIIHLLNEKNQLIQKNNITKNQQHIPLLSY